MNKFKIETVAWEWPKPVKNKDVYRDDEFIRTKTKAAALEAIDFLFKKGPIGGHSYTITVFRDGEYFTYWRHSMPCLGGLVKYLDTHGKRYSMNPYFPRDIKVMFPKGDIIFIACNVQEIKGPYQEFLLSQESPWVSAFGSRSQLILKDKYFVLTDMTTDPTLLYSLKRMACFGTAVNSRYSQYSKWNPKADILASHSLHSDPRRLAGQKPIRISGGTWAEGFGYTRPYNDCIFKTSIPLALKDFITTLGKSQYGTYDKNYFIKIMKSRYKLDVSKGVPVTKAAEEALLDAWDFFKKESKKLGDKPGEEYK